MLRLAVLVLLLANAGYYAWSQGLLRDWGLAPASDAEPQRLRQQIAPQNLQLLSPQGQAVGRHPSAPPPEPERREAPAPTPAAAEPTAATAPAPAPSSPPAVAAAPKEPREPTSCLQAGVFDDKQAGALRSALAALPAGSWRLDPTPIAGRWMVYMGRFPDEEIVARKRAELRELKIGYDRPGAAFEPGLSLGRFSTEEAAQRGMAQLASQGVRTARVVQERAEAQGFTLRLPAAGATLRARVEAQRTALAGKTLRGCSD